MEQDYLIAGLRVRMDTYGRAARQAEPYEIPIEGQPDLRIHSHSEQVQERQPHLSMEDCEYLSTGASFYRQLLRFNGLLIHASAVAMDGYAYLFSAPCGTGKSTHTSLWRRAFGEDRVIMLNDDKPALRREDGVWYAYGTPWSGKTALNTNIRVPLGGVCMLSRGQTNEIEPFGGSKAIFALMEQTARTSDAEGRILMMETLDKLMTEVPVWRMQCLPTEEAARVSHEAMSREAQKRFGK